uniref:J domain-containing protein n=1 Tax=Meloidogyne hapla TaxID=6305 RepID=A0A1I8B4J3_MELHA
MNFAVNLNKFGLCHLVVINLSSKNNFPLYFTSTVSFSTASDGRRDYYKVLGVQRSSTAEEIKDAFYKLSKKYHPDVNPENKEKASKSFHEVSEAYEVLGSKEKRRAYDSLTAEMPTKTFKATHHQRTKTGEQRQRKWEKDWSDLDIDYKDFEHFQNLSRKKRMFHNSATNTSENFWAAQQEAASNYRSNLAREREIRERQLQLQLDERRRREEHPMPTFEKLRLQTEKLEREAKKDRLFKYLSLLPILIFAIVCLGPGRATRGF